MLAIHAVNLTKSFGAKRAVSGMNLEVPAGQRVAMLGANGAGKTTTLMMLLGLTAPDEGSVRIFGHVMPAERLAALRNVAFTASYLGMPYGLRVRQFLGLFADVYEAPSVRVGEVCEQMGLTDLEDRRSHQLSSGQKTMVGLAKCLLARPRLLVMDEPTASLDPHTAWRVRRALTEVTADGTTLLLTSHNMADVEALAERVVFLRAGRVIADDAPSALAGRGGLDGFFRDLAEEDA